MRASIRRLRVTCAAARPTRYQCSRKASAGRAAEFAPGERRLRRAGQDGKAQPLGHRGGAGKVRAAADQDDRPAAIRDGGAELPKVLQRVA
jgi:hypothetical protein